MGKYTLFWSVGLIGIWSTKRVPVRKAKEQLMWNFLSTKSNFLTPISLQESYIWIFKVKVMHGHSMDKVISIQLYMQLGWC